MQANKLLANVSGTPGYAALQLSKGRIIIIDNELNEGMIINRKYVLAHTSNIVLKKPKFSHAVGLAGIENLLGQDLFGAQAGLA